MTRSSCVSVLFFLAPFIITPSEDDSSYTDAWFAAAGGRYTEPGCNTTTERPFQEVGAKISHKTNGPFRLGMQGGVIHMDSPSNSLGAWVWPELALDWKYGALGTTGLRIGSLDEVYVNAGLFNGVPLFAHGMMELGVGGRIERSPMSRFWVGATALPYSTWGPTARLDFPIGESGKSIFLLGHYGNFRGHDEFAVGLGYRIRTN